MSQPPGVWLTQGGEGYSLGPQGRLKAPALPLSQDHLPLGHLPLPAGSGEREKAAWVQTQELLFWGKRA